MEFLTELWLPILLSAVAVFIASSVIWMATPLHKKDYSNPPDQDGILDVLRRTPFQPGLYFLPWAADCRSGMKDPEFQAKLKAGPWAQLIIPPGAPSFGRSLVQWFINSLVVSALIAYVAAVALPMGAAAPEYMRVFRLVGSAAFLAHAGMAAHDTMWKGLGWRFTLTKLFDGLVYALLTAGVFAWLWPREGVLPLT